MTCWKLLRSRVSGCLLNTQWVLGLSCDLRSSARRLCAVQEVCNDIPMLPRVLGAVNHIKERKQYRQRRKSCHHRQVGWRWLSCLPPSFPLCLYLIHNVFLLPLTSPPYLLSVTLSPSLFFVAPLSFSPSLHLSNVVFFSPPLCSLFWTSYLLPVFSSYMHSYMLTSTFVSLLLFLRCVQTECEAHLRGCTITYTYIHITPFSNLL